jgi:hypothetical protein
LSVLFFMGCHHKEFTTSLHRWCGFHDSLVPIGNLSCGCFIYPLYHWQGCPQIGASSADWTPQSRFLPEDGDRVQSPKRCFKT